MTDAEFPDPETELAFLDFLATEWPNWRHHVGSDYWHIRRRSFLAGRPAPQALAATPAVGGEALRETISNAIMKIVSNRDDLGYTHFIEIRDSIFAAIAAQPASPLRGKWQPIETAPRDGSRILATGGGLGDVVEIVSYNENVGSWDTPEYTLDDRDNEAEGYSRPSKWQHLPSSASPPEQPAAADELWNWCATCRNNVDAEIIRGCRRFDCPNEKPTAPDKQPLTSDGETKV